MHDVDEQTDVPQTTVSGLLLNAAAINVVLVAALFTAGLIFAVNLATAAVVALAFSVVAWACAALVLIPVGLAPGRRLRQDAEAELMHDSWLDDFEP